LDRFLTCPPYPNVLQTCDHLGTHRAYFLILAASALMKNFLRALRYAWPYRGRLIFSVICAVMAAIFWGLTLATIYPVLQGLGKKQTLHDWVKVKINDTKENVRGNKIAVDGITQEIQRTPSGNDQRVRDLTGDLAKFEGVRWISWVIPSTANLLPRTFSLVSLI